MTEGADQARAREGVGLGDPARADLDQLVQEVRSNALRWALTPARERADLVERAIRDTRAAAKGWNAASCRAKGLDPSGAEGAEELVAGIGMFVRLLSAYRRALLDIARTGRPRLPGPLRHRPGGRLGVRVLPSSLLDRVLYSADVAEVWLEPGVDEAALRATQAWAYQHPRDHAGLILVLGAGNVASLAPKDVMHHLIVEGRVVILKANPVNDYLIEYWEQALAGFIESGFVRIVAGGTSTGEYLAHHPGVDRVHLTGSESTYNAVVFGAGPLGGARRERGEVVLDKPVSAELGNVSPVVIVPGRWSRRELEYQAAHVATMIVNNAGFNCLTPRVIVTHRGWDQRGAFLDELERCLAEVRPRVAYYPGAFDRHQQFLAAHPEAHLVGDVAPGCLAWTLIRDVDARRDDPCFRVEAFCSLTCETALEGSSTEEFLGRAVNFCNESLHGTLSMTLLVDPRTRRQRAVSDAVDRAVADLRYGTIGINVWHALGIMIATTPWGAYPGHEPGDIQSGTGSVGNAFMIARAQKSVVRGPFVAWPTPAWFVTHRHGPEALRRLFDVQCTQSWWRVPGLVAAALRS